MWPVLLAAVFLVEAFDATFGVDQFLLASPKRMAAGGDFQTDLVVFNTVDFADLVRLHGGTAEKLRASRSINKNNGMVGRMNFSFHIQ